MKSLSSRASSSAFPSSSVQSQGCNFGRVCTRDSRAHNPRQGGSPEPPEPVEMRRDACSVRGASACVCVRCSFPASSSPSSSLAHDVSHLVVLHPASFHLVTLRQSLQQPISSARTDWVYATARVGNLASPRPTCSVPRPVLRRRPSGIA